LKAGTDELKLLADRLIREDEADLPPIVIESLLEQWQDLTCNNAA
jgi:hypothetical protein